MLLRELERPRAEENLMKRGGLGDEEPKKKS